MLTRGDVHVDSTRWIRSHRHSLYSDEDHLFSSDFCLSLGETKKRTNSINNPLLESFTNKIKANPGVRSWFYRSSTRLSVSGRVEQVALKERFLFERRIVPEAGAFIDRWMA